MSDRGPPPAAQAIFDDLVALYRGDQTGRALSDPVFEILLRIRDCREEALEFALAGGGSGRDAREPAKRAALAGMLGEVASGDPEHALEVLRVLVAMAADVEDAVVICALADALGKIWDPAACVPLVRWATHEDDGVRIAVASSLQGSLGEPPDSEAVAALIGLSHDPNAGVRDWATFGLALSDARGPEVDQALLDRLADGDVDARAEGFRGLAERYDHRAIEPLIALLGTSGPISSYEVEAAGRLADVRLYPALHAMSGWSDLAEDGWLAWATRRCDPALRSMVIEKEAAVVAGLREALPDAAGGGAAAAVHLEGAYPHTDVVVVSGPIRICRPVWSEFDDDPERLDVAFTIQRVLSWLAAPLE